MKLSILVELLLAGLIGLVAASSDPISVPAPVSVSVSSTPSCSDFNPETVKLITFDVFAALMDLETSLIASVKKISPSWDDRTVSNFVETWEGAYGDYAGTVFNESISGPEPFLWMLDSTLTQTLATQSLTATDAQREALIKAWSYLTPWVNTKESLAKLYNAGFSLGALSNGDRNTLTTAMKVFLPDVKFTYIFPSDFPVGSFKPDAAMYDQLQTSTNFTTSEILHVAGAPIDGWGSRSAGLFSALLSLVPYPKKPFPCFLLKDITGVPPIFGL